ncbi:MAG TPA: bifunctional nuclease family protein [Thermoanaerobaculia bacterium]|jgi:bifunctional DNase/RNase|nr:bifunctional nuclease family protein [Thermoanaerobaculia bacterium]
MVKMEIKGLLMDPVSNMPVVILRDAGDGVFLPIWVGIFEANAIAIAMEKIATPRPMTHDLLNNLVRELDARVDRIVINDLKDNTFFARIHLSRAGATWTVDSRPSDAIALALRCQSEIFVEEEVLEKSKTLRADGDPDPERLKKWLEEVNPEDLGKYRM